MIEVDVIKVGDKLYDAIKEVKDNDTTYVLLVNEEDEKDMMFRKKTKENPDLYVPLDSKEEVDLASLLLIKNGVTEE